MSGRDPIRRLGELYGINSSYTDFWGKRRRVSGATERALLTAMGVAVGSPREVEDSLREAEARPWRRMLAPVRVIAPPEPVEITFTLPARLGGAAVDWTLVQESGETHEGRAIPDDLPVAAAAEVDGESYRRWRMALPRGLPHGYHRLSMTVRDRSCAGDSLQLILTPERCYGPGRSTRLWGLTAQLYGVRSRRNWGIGDFTDLAELAEQAAALGASAIGVNPLHALFPADASHISPYSPSSRLFLNVCYLDLEAVPDFAESIEARALLDDAGFRDELDRARAAELVDYPAAWRLKLRVLELLFQPFRERHLAGASARARRVPDVPDRDGRGARAACAVRCACRSTRCAPRAPGPGRYGRSRFAIRTARRSTRSPASTGSASNSSPICSGRPTAARHGAGARPRRRHAARPLQGHRRGGEPGGRQGLGESRTSCLSGASVGAPPDLFNLHGQNWGCRRSRRPACASAPMAVHRDAARQHAPCRRACASITSWGCSACSGSRTAQRRPKARTCAIRSPTSRASSRSKSSVSAAW